MFMCFMLIDIGYFCVCIITSSWQYLRGLMIIFVTSFERICDLPSITTSFEKESQIDLVSSGQKIVVSNPTGRGLHMDFMRQQVPSKKSDWCATLILSWFLAVIP